MDAEPRAKTMRVNCITTFLFNVSQCITFNKTKQITATLIAEVLFKSLYSRLGFKFIKYFATSPHFERGRKQFHCESGKSKVFQKQTIVLQFYLTIPQCVTIVYDNRIDFNENKDVFKYLN